MSKPKLAISYVVASLVLLLFLTCEVEAQRGGGKGGGGRSPGHAAPSGPRHNAGPAMSRPGGGAPPHGNPGGPANRDTPGGGATRPGSGAKPNGGFQRPTSGNHESPPRGAVGGRTPGSAERPNIAARPGNGPSSSLLNDFLGGGNRPSEGGRTPGVGQPGRPNGERSDRPVVGQGNRAPATRENPRLTTGDVPPIAGRGKTTANGNVVNVGDVNIGNSVDYSRDQKTWVNNQHASGNQVRANAGNRYATAYNNGNYRHGAVGGYHYYNSWGNHGAYYGWHPATYAAVGAFTGAAWASAPPQYYAYGTGGNVYYENNVVYVNGQAAGTPAQYTQQASALVAAAPAAVNDTEWLPLGTFAFTQEGVSDSQAMIELAVNKQGVLAGTYYNETTQVTRALKGTIDQTNQRAALGFADGKNADLVLETGINNLTQDEAPCLLHAGAERTTPVLLVRLQAPTAPAGN